MDGESTNDVIVVGEDATTAFSTIPLMLDFEEPETVNPVTVNNEPVEMEPEPQQEVIAELAVPPAVSTAATTVTAIRLGSGADDNPTTAASDVEEENMDRRARRTRSRGRRSRRGRSRRSRSRRSRRSRSRSDYDDFYVQIADEEISAAPAGSSRGSRKTARGGRRAKKVAITGRRGGKAAQSSHAREEATPGTSRGRNSVRGSRRGRKTAECVTARTMWSERLRPISLLQNKKSKAK